MSRIDPVSYKGLLTYLGQIYQVLAADYQAVVEGKVSKFEPKAVASSFDGLNELIAQTFVVPLDDGTIIKKGDYVVKRNDIGADGKFKPGEGPEMMVNETPRPLISGDLSAKIGGEIYHFTPRTERSEDTPAWEPQGESDVDLDEYVFVSPDKMKGMAPFTPSVVPAPQPVDINTYKVGQKVELFSPVKVGQYTTYRPLGRGVVSRIKTSFDVRRSEPVLNSVKVDVAGNPFLSAFYTVGYTPAGGLPLISETTPSTTTHHSFTGPEFKQYVLILIA